MQAILRSDPTKCLGKLHIPVLFVFFLIPLICDAQVQQTQQNSTSEVTASADGGDSNDAVLHELDAMRKRIEQLEAQLRAQSTAKSETTSIGAAERLESARQSLLPADTAPVVSSAMEPSAATASATEPSIATASISAQKSATTSATPPEKSAPFAFADFTWLNGNPRTEDSGFRLKVLHARDSCRC